jgi:hypothetical protein
MLYKHFIHCVQAVVPPVFVGSTTGAPVVFAVGLDQAGAWGSAATVGATTVGATTAGSAIGAETVEAATVGLGVA